jgi:HAE1 family hydrophobic/amphiphilic exporter-1
MKLKILRSLIIFLLLAIGPGTTASVASDQEKVKVVTLEQALTIALERNRDIQKAREYRNQVEGKYLEERAAALPQFQIKAGISRDRDESQSAFGNFLPVERETRMAGIGFSQLLYSFGQVEAAIRAAKIGIATADDQLRLYQQAALKEASAGFHDCLLSDELLAIAQQNLDQKRRFFDEVRKKYALGVATDYDVLAGKVNMENAGPPVIRAENQRVIARDRLRFLLGLEEKGVEVQGTLEAPISPYPHFEAALKTALEQRPELVNLKNRRGIAEELINITQAAVYPKIDLRAGYGWQGLDISTAQADGPTWTAGLFVTFPFFDGLRTQGRVLQAKSEAATLKIEESKLLDTIVLQTREAIQAVREAGEIVKALSGTVAQAERLLAMAEKGYEFGVKTRLEVDDVQLSLVQAKGNLARAKRDYLVAQVTLRWVMGTLSAQQ